MPRNPLPGLVAFCTRHAWPVALLATLLGGAAAIHAAGRFAISTDTDRLFPSDLAWRKLQLATDRDFPQRGILVVLDAPTAELASDAAARLAAGLRAPSLRDRIASVETPASGPYFEREGLLFAPLSRLRPLTELLGRGAQALGQAARAPDLRGAMAAVSFEAEAAGRDPSAGDAASRLLQQVAQAARASLAGRAASVGWRAALSGPDAAPPTRAYVTVSPHLDFHALEPGRAATDAIRAEAGRLDLAGRDLARVRMTGTVPINDEEFGTLQHGQVVSLIATGVAVLVILFLALRSPRIIAAVAGTLAVGFALTCEAGLFLVGSFNAISIAFAVLFVGLGADFGIQFSVRYRAERFERPDDPQGALVAAARKAGTPLTLAAAGTTVGFFSFLPTQYRGVSELGLIAGVGMLIAYASTMTVLPALLAILRPPPEPEKMGFAALAAGDRFMARHRFAVVGGTLGIVVLGLPLLAWLQFDFDPTHLQVASKPAVETYRDLATSGAGGVVSIEIAARNLDAAEALAHRLDRLPEVAGTHTAASLVPDDQEAKLAVVSGLREKLAGALDAAKLPAASDADSVAALRRTAAGLSAALAASPDRELVRAGGAASDALSALASGPASARERADAAIARPLGLDLGLLRRALGAGEVTVATLPSAVARDWITPSGVARIEVRPKGDSTNDATLAAFAHAVQRAAPRATGGPITLIESRRTVVVAFAEAGAFAIAAIALVLAVALRRVGDVALTLLPLLVAGVLTLEISVLIGLKLNFANIIALPLLLGVGVAFKIYYVMAWRHGARELLRSTLTRAVLFSALTTATAFGSLWLSPEPGLSSMGELMALALACTLAAAVLFQPALMGPPRNGDGGRAERKQS